MTQPEPFEADITAALDALATTDRLLVTSDFDGTMAPIVAIPSEARTNEATQVALSDLARLADTSVAVVSGRSLEVLGELTDLPATVHLVGSHGMEFDTAFAAGLSGEERARLDELNRQAEALAARFPGLEVEKKPASTALHYRHVEVDLKTQAVRAIDEGPAAIDGAHVTTGKEVVEIAALPTSKAFALDRLREQVGATALVFLGDDVTDENAFNALSPPDIGVKVGPGQTAAAVRVEDTDDVARFLTELARLRRAYLEGSGA